ncbi:cytochrome c oxidase subunit 3 family protein [Rhodobacteraceae bacterium KMS-5]|uniref:Cytochrome c oxidase subunit 3 family protein n=2 Tax=Tabrizicola oligotrophica TaxID=2710650 RepID=A0A6M0QXF5_9RHOB|nr:cytochrome c oxidase subunit 3 family protein [Tabrizicola oligotrophica]
MTAAQPTARHDEKPKASEEGAGGLPGELMIWVLIISELVVFGAGLLALLATRLTDPAGFAEAQSHLHRVGAAVNTVVLVSSGYLAALAVRLAAARPGLARLLLILAAGLGAVFLAVKASEYAALFAQGIGTETHAFFTFSYLLTGFHAAHVLAGMVLLLLVAVRPAPRPVGVAAAFWHMVDLVWVLLVPVVYLL